MPETVLEVRFYYESKEFMIRFPDNDRASQFLRKATDGYHKRGKDDKYVFFSLPSTILYVRTSSTLDNIVFAFNDEAAARDWGDVSFLGKSHGKDVRINLKWDEADLDEKIGMKRAASPAGLLGAAGNIVGALGALALAGKNKDRKGRDDGSDRFRNTANAGSHEGHHGGYRH